MSLQRWGEKVLLPFFTRLLLPQFLLILNTISPSPKSLHLSKKRSDRLSLFLHVLGCATAANTTGAQGVICFLCQAPCSCIPLDKKIPKDVEKFFGNPVDGIETALEVLKVSRRRPWALLWTNFLTPRPTFCFSAPASSCCCFSVPEGPPVSPDLPPQEAGHQAAGDPPERQAPDYEDQGNREVLFLFLFFSDPMHPCPPTFNC